MLMPKWRVDGREQERIALNLILNAFAKRVKRQNIKKKLTRVLENTYTHTCINHIK